MSITRRDALSKMGTIAGSGALAGWLGKINKLEETLNDELKLECIRSN